jgi:hypothetical protein
MKRRGFLASLAGLAVTPTVAARLLAPAPELFGFPLIYGQHYVTGLPAPLLAGHDAGAYLVPPDFARDLFEYVDGLYCVRHLPSEDEA